MVHLFPAMQSAEERQYPLHWQMDSIVGEAEGAAVRGAVGIREDGGAVGAVVGAVVVAEDGCAVGAVEGVAVDNTLGHTDGSAVGLNEVGVADGLNVVRGNLGIGLPKVYPPRD